MSKPAFIVVEGLEGAGKSSVIKAISEFLHTNGETTVTTREPGGTPMAEAIRDCVKQTWDGEEVTEQTELLLMYAARSQLVHNVIKPALAKGHFVVGDRHDLSSIAYQGGGRQVDLEKLSQLRHLTLGDFRPDFTLYLDIEPSLGLQRARGRGELDRIELAGIAFFERAREMYQCQIKALDNAVTIDASQNMLEVKNAVISALNTWYHQRSK